MKSILRLAAMTLAAAATLASAQLVQARDYISIVGSSTVYPFSTVVAERLGRSTDFPTPTVESTGSGGGLKLFCNGVGVDTADISNASRRIKRSEFDRCRANGVKDIVEVQIGFDGIVLANTRKAKELDLTRREIYLALAKQVPNPDGSKTLVANPYKNWSEIDPSLPDHAIEVLGPPPTSGTRDAFVELVMDHGCATFDFLSAMEETDPDHFKTACQTLREDGGYIEAGENDNLIVQKLEKNPAAVGIFGFSFLDQNSDKIQGSHIEGVAPTFDNIGDKSYPVSRPLFFYIKKAHVGVVPGIPEYIREFTSEKAWGPDGYLAEKGMIPLGDEMRAEMRKQARNLETMSEDEL